MMYNHRDIVKEELDKIFSQTPVKGKKVLEIGAGWKDNISADSFQSYFESKGSIYLGVDKYPSEKGILEQDAHDLNLLKDEEFDIVFSCHTFEHFINPLQALKEMRRVLKEDGMLILATPSPCEHHILGADWDHIFVLNIHQMRRLLMYSDFYPVSYYKMFYKNLQLPEQDFCTFTVGRKYTWEKQK